MGYQNWKMYLFSTVYRELADSNLVEWPFVNIWTNNDTILKKMLNKKGKKHNRTTLHINKNIPICSPIWLFPACLQRWELPVFPLQAAEVKGHPRSSGSGIRSPWGTVVGLPGKPIDGNIFPCGTPPQTHCPASAGAHLWRNRGLFPWLNNEVFIACQFRQMSECTFPYSFCFCHLV